MTVWLDNRVYEAYSAEASCCTQMGCSVLFQLFSQLVSERCKKHDAYIARV